MKRILLLLLALFAFLLGLIGLVLPVIPQVPFFAASVILASVASTRIRERVKKTQLYQKYLAEWIGKNRFLVRLFENGGEEDAAGAALHTAQPDRSTYGKAGR